MTYLAISNNVISYCNIIPKTNSCSKTVEYFKEPLVKVVNKTPFIYQCLSEVEENTWSCHINTIVYIDQYKDLYCFINTIAIGYYGLIGYYVIL